MRYFLDYINQARETHSKWGGPFLLAGVLDWIESAKPAEYQLLFPSAFWHCGISPLKVPPSWPPYHDELCAQTVSWIELPLLSCFCSVFLSQQHKKWLTRGGNRKVLGCETAQPWGGGTAGFWDATERKATLLMAKFILFTRFSHVKCGKFVCSI